MGKCLFMRKGIVHTIPGSRLPSGYTELAYIQSSGTQYINTVFKPNQDTRIVCDFELLSSNVLTSVFGARISYKNTAFVLWGGGDSSKTHFQDDYSNESDTTISSNAGKYSIDKNKNSTAINSSTHTFNSANFQSAYQLYICAINTAGTAVFGTGGLRIYSFQIYDDGTLVRDFFPCIKDDGEVGLYDLVGKQFYGNAGTGVFTGSEVA